MIEILLAALIVATVAQMLVLVAVHRRLWLLMGSVECLCTNVSRLADRLRPGDHAHGD